MSDPRTITVHARSQLRRLGFAGACAMLAALVLYRHLDGYVGILPTPLAVAFFYSGVVILAGFVTTYYLPRIRRLIEAVAVSRLSLAAGALAVPELGPQLSVAPLTNATLVVGGAIVMLALAPAVHALCQAPHAPRPLRAVSDAAHRGVCWIDEAQPPAATRGATVRT